MVYKSIYFKVNHNFANINCCTILIIIAICASTINLVYAGEITKDDNSVEINQLINKDGVYYIKSNNKPYSGPVHYIGNNNQILRKGYFENGKLEGIMTTYIDNKILQTVTFKNGIQNGLGTIYVESGKVEGMVINGVNQGVWSVYKPNGIKVSEHFLVDGLKNGICKKYDVNDGHLVSEEMYVNDKLEGETRMYHPNGRPILVTMFQNGVANGPGTGYTKTGFKICEGNWKNGKMNGVWISWDPITGEKTTEITYKNGNLVRTKKY